MTHPSVASPYCPLDIVPEPATLDLRARTVTTRFGQLHLVCSEPAKRAEVATLFLHGVGSSWRTWTPLLQSMKTRGAAWGDLLLVDLPGFGASENRLRHLDAQLVGEELLKAAEALGYSRVNLVGHSMGGFLALDMASHGHRALRCVAVVSGAYYSIVDTVQTPLRALSRKPRTALSYLSLALLSTVGLVNPRLLGSTRRQRWLAPALRPVFAEPHRLRASVLQHLCDRPRPGSFRLAARNGRGYDCAQRWSPIGVPVWAVFGERDLLVPLGDKARLEQSLASATTHALPEWATSPTSSALSGSPSRSGGSWSSRAPERFTRPDGRGP